MPRSLYLKDWEVSFYFSRSMTYSWYVSCSSLKTLFRNSIDFSCFDYLIIDIIISCGVNWSLISARFVVSIIYSVCFFLSKQYSFYSLIFLASLNFMLLSKLSLSLRASSNSCSNLSLSYKISSSFG